MDAVIGVDVGTGSARAGVFDGTGRMLGQASRAIQAWRPEADYVQQSTTDIWAAVSAAVREALAQAGAVTVRGIGFDATCSLVVLDADAGPVSVSPDGSHQCGRP
jgi:ribulose kinase